MAACQALQRTFFKNFFFFNTTLSFKDMHKRLKLYLQSSQPPETGEINLCTTTFWDIHENVITRAHHNPPVVADAKY